MEAAECDFVNLVAAYVHSTRDRRLRQSLPRKEGVSVPVWSFDHLFTLKATEM